MVGDKGHSCKGVKVTAVVEDRDAEEIIQPLGNGSVDVT